MDWMNFPIGIRECSSGILFLPDFSGICLLTLSYNERIYSEYQTVRLLIGFMLTPGQNCILFPHVSGSNVHSEPDSSSAYKCYPLRPFALTCSPWLFASVCLNGNSQPGYCKSSLRWSPTLSWLSLTCRFSYTFHNTSKTLHNTNDNFFLMVWEDYPHTGSQKLLNLSFGSNCLSLP